MEEHNLKRINDLLHNVTMDINSAECEMMKIKDKDDTMKALDKRLSDLWQEAYRIRKEFQNLTIRS